MNFDVCVVIMWIYHMIYMQIVYDFCLVLYYFILHVDLCPLDRILFCFLCQMSLVYGSNFLILSTKIMHSRQQNDGCCTRWETKMILKRELLISFHIVPFIFSFSIFLCYRFNILHIICIYSLSSCCRYWDMKQFFMVLCFISVGWELIIVGRVE